MPDATATTRLLLAYVFVVDKAVREYAAGRLALLQHFHDEEGETVALVEGLGRFETCISAAKRALRLLTALGNKPDSPVLDRELRKLALSRNGGVTEVRDAIEHIDQDIVSSGGLKVGEAHMLAVNKTGTHLEIADHDISFCTLRATLGVLHRAGIELIDALRDVAQVRGVERTGRDDAGKVHPSA